MAFYAILSYVCRFLGRLPFVHLSGQTRKKTVKNAQKNPYGYSKKFANITIDELVKWNGIVVGDGVRGGTEGAIY